MCCREVVCSCSYCISLPYFCNLSLCCNLWLVYMSLCSFCVSYCGFVSPWSFCISFWPCDVALWLFWFCFCVSLVALCPFGIVSHLSEVILHLFLVVPHLFFIILYLFGSRSIDYLRRNVKKSLKRCGPGALLTPRALRLFLAGPFTNPSMHGTVKILSFLVIKIQSKR